MRRALALLVLLLSCPAVSWAGYSSCGLNCYLADTASASDVQSAIDACDAASGGEVRIPSGTVNYGTQVYKNLTHNLVLSGAGVTKTIITNTMSNSPAVYLKANGSIALTIQHIKFISTPGSAGHGTLSVGGTSLAVLMTDLYFDMSGGGRGLAWGGADATGGGGVITRSTWYNPTPGGQGIEFWGTLDGINGVWDGIPTFGTANAKYVEDSTFLFLNGPADGAFDAYAGARVVFRYNTVIGTNVGWHGCDSSNSPHSFEVYKNTFASIIGNASIVSNMRGGTAVIWGNRADASYGTLLILALYRSCHPEDGTGLPGHICDGTSPYDGNTGGNSYGYRCYQQPGATGVSGLVQWPIIEWDNIRGTGSTPNITFALNANFNNPLCGHPWDQSTYLQEKRDFIGHNTCVGDGGAFCTTWWDDVGKKAKNYTPYPYPHPLTHTPRPPAGVRIVR